MADGDMFARFGFDAIRRQLDFMKPDTALEVRYNYENCESNCKDEPYDPAKENCTLKTTTPCGV